MKLLQWFENSKAGMRDLGIDGDEANRLLKLCEVLVKEHRVAQMVQQSLTDAEGRGLDAWRKAVRRVEELTWPQ